jgi:hypothetical protein
MAPPRRRQAHADDDDFAPESSGHPSLASQSSNMSAATDRMESATEPQNWNAPLSSLVAEDAYVNEYGVVVRDNQLSDDDYDTYITLRTASQRIPLGRSVEHPPLPTNGAGIGAFQQF